jgi:transaldolase
MNTGTRAVFLDRDGVLNRVVLRDGKPYPPASASEMEIVPDAAEALADLKKLGYRLIVVTNQPDIGRGRQKQEVVDAMHQRLRETLPLDDILVCHHTDGDGCDCRKPRPGLILRAAARHGIHLPASVMVGDRWRDVEAGENAGCRTVLIECGYQEQGPRVGPSARVTCLREAADWIIGQELTESGRKLGVKLFADGADKRAMLELYSDPSIAGFTTNPTLMREAGITDYEGFARDVLATIVDRPISFEVFADELPEIERQALRIAGWGGNVYVKIPITNTKGESLLGLIRRLSHAGVKVNVTAVLALDQVREAISALSGGAPSYISVFAGRVADTGRDPVPLMADAVQAMRPHPQMELIWASPRELLNVFQAGEAGCHIITITSNIRNKLGLIGKDLRSYSLETVQMFRNDALRAGYQL